MRTETRAPVVDDVNCKHGGRWAYAIENIDGSWTLSCDCRLGECEPREVSGSGPALVDAARILAEKSVCGCGDAPRIVRTRTTTFYGCRNWRKADPGCGWTGTIGGLPTHVIRKMLGDA